MGWPSGPPPGRVNEAILGRRGPGVRYRAPLPPLLKNDKSLSCLAPPPPLTWSAAALCCLAGGPAPKSSWLPPGRLLPGRGAVLVIGAKWRTWPPRPSGPCRTRLPSARPSQALRPAVAPEPCCAPQSGADAGHGKLEQGRGAQHVLDRMQPVTAAHVAPPDRASAVQALNHKHASAGPIARTSPLACALTLPSPRKDGASALLPGPAPAGGCRKLMRGGWGLAASGSSSTQPWASWPSVAAAAATAAALAAAPAPASATCTPSPKALPCCCWRCWCESWLDPPGSGAAMAAADTEPDAAGRAPDGCCCPCRGCPGGHAA